MLKPHKPEIGEQWRISSPALTSRCAKLGLAGLYYHDLHRTFITDAEYAGTPRHEVMKIAGHLTECELRNIATFN